MKQYSYALGIDPRCGAFDSLQFEPPTGALFWCPLAANWCPHVCVAWITQARRRVCGARGSLCQPGQAQPMLVLLLILLAPSVLSDLIRLLQSGRAGARAGGLSGCKWLQMARQAPAGGGGVQESAELRPGPWQRQDVPGGDAGECATAGSPCCCSFLVVQSNSAFLGDCTASKQLFCSLDSASSMRSSRENGRRRRQGWPRPRRRRLQVSCQQLQLHSAWRVHAVTGRAQRVGATAAAVAYSCTPRGNTPRGAGVS